MTSLLFAFVSLASSFSQAKELTISCRGKYEVKLEATVANVNSPMQIHGLYITGRSMSPVKDVSKYPVYDHGEIAISLVFGQALYDSIRFNVNRCEDSFSATGSAELKNHVGGFAGTSNYRLDCSCELK